jgi:hypothetical protein
MNDTDVLEFMRVGLAAICALAFVGWQYDAIRLAMKARDEDAQ